MAAGRPAAFACRQGYPAAAPPPLNSRGRATMPPGPLASVYGRQAPLPDGGERYSHSQHDAKVADIAATAARIARPVQAGRPWARCGNIDPRVAPSGRAVGKYFLACPCLRAVAVIGWGRIAVPSVSAV